MALNPMTLRFPPPRFRLLGLLQANYTFATLEGAAELPCLLFGGAKAGCDIRFRFTGYTSGVEDS